MNRILILLFSLILFFLPAYGQNLKADLDKKFKKYTLVALDSKAIQKKIDKNEEALIGNFQAYLETNHLFSNRLIASETPATVKPVKGKLKGFGKSEVRLTFGDQLRGYIYNEQQIHYIEPATRFSSHAKPLDYIIYQGSDVIGADVPNLSNDMVYGQKIVESSIQSMGGFDIVSSNHFRIIEIATEADYQWVQYAGGATQANNEIVNLINMAEGVYERQLDLTFDIVAQIAWTTPDPYPSTSDAYLLLEKFRDYWNTYRTNIPRDVAHLFTGRSLIAIDGLAYQSKMCITPSEAYSLTRRSSEYFWWQTFAHEIGHNLGANHTDGITGCGYNLMQAPPPPIAEEFCQYSIGEINNFIHIYGSCLQPTFPRVPKTKFDFDGDLKADISVFRPSTATWWVRNISAVQFGISTDKIVPADYDNDGKTDYAVFRNGTWYILRSSDSGTTIASWGTTGDKPVPADYDGDGKADLAIFRPSTSQWWYLRSADGTTRIFQFGYSTDKLVPDEYTGDGKADIAVWRPSTGEWFILRSQDQSMITVLFGSPGDVPTSADFDGDGRADYVIYRDGHWWVRGSSTGLVSQHQKGGAGDIPVPADYDGDGRADVSVFKTSTGVWSFINNDVQFGTNGDIPIPGFLIVQ